MEHATKLKAAIAVNREVEPAPRAKEDARARASVDAKLISSMWIPTFWVSIMTLKREPATRR
jgi:hypothetical protein